MSHLLAILALMRAWINKITPESSIVHYHSFSMPVSLLCVPNSPSSITYCNIVVKAILQTQPRWPHEREVMFTILPCWPLTVLQHPNTLQYRENTCVLPADIPHMEIHISPRSMTNSSMNPCNSAVTHKVPTKSIEFCRFSMLHRFLWYAVTANPRTLMHNDYVWRSHMQGLMFWFRFSLLQLWPAPRISWCRELSSGASDSIPYVRWL